MKRMQSVVLFLLGTLAFIGCTKSEDPSVTSEVSLTMSAASADGSTSIGGRSSIDGRIASNITITDVKVNFRSIEFVYDRNDDHYKKDSTYREVHDVNLKGPFIVDLMHSGSFAEKVITLVKIPNAKYEKVKFQIFPSAENGDMKGKSILITGRIGDTPFVFWHSSDPRFEVKFADGSSLKTSGAAFTMAIHFELDKILSKIKGGADLSLAHDGNNDGTITIDPLNDDGNKDLANAIMLLIRKYSHLEKK